MYGAQGGALADRAAVCHGETEGGGALVVPSGHRDNYRSLSRIGLGWCDVRWCRTTDTVKPHQIAVAAQMGIG